MKHMKCVCGKNAHYSPNLTFNGESIDGWQCSCGQVYFNPEKVERLLLINKLKKQKYKLKLGQIKSNLVLRIPKEVGEALNLKKSQHVECRVKNDKELVLHSMDE